MRIGLVNMGILTVSNWTRVDTNYFPCVSYLKKLSKSSAQICWYPPNLFATLTQNPHCVRINWVVVLPTDLHNFSWIGFYFEIKGAIFYWGGGGAMVCLCPPPPPPPHTHTLLTPHFYYPLELYVYITLTNNYLAFFIYQLIILWTISINCHRWLLLNNHISKYNSFILVLYRRYINYLSVCPHPAHVLAPSYATADMLNI